MNNFISVVIPTSCRPIDILNHAVQSVEEQSLPAHEIIIVDDNSDGKLSQNIILYCQKKTLFIQSPTTLGLPLPSMSE